MATTRIITIDCIYRAVNPRIIIYHFWPRRGICETRKCTMTMIEIADSTISTIYRLPWNEKCWVQYHPHSEQQQWLRQGQFRRYLKLGRQRMCNAAPIVDQRLPNWQSKLCLAYWHRTCPDRNGVWPTPMPHFRGKIIISGSSLESQMPTPFSLPLQAGAFNHKLSLSWPYSPTLQENRRFHLQQSERLWVFQWERQSADDRTNNNLIKILTIAVNYVLGLTSTLTPTYLIRSHWTLNVECWMSI